jgi:hypothetical protein
MFSTSKSPTPETPNEGAMGREIMRLSRELASDLRHGAIFEVTGEHIGLRTAGGRRWES